MKVLMVTPFYTPVIGGTESFIQSTSMKLNEIGISTDILTYNIEEGQPLWKTAIGEMDKSRIMKTPCHYVKGPLKLLQVSKIPGSFQSLMKEYDIIHYHNETDLSLPLFSYFVKKPKLMHCHCLDVSYPFYKKNPVSRQIFRKIADIHIAVSKSIQHLLIDLGVPKHNVKIVPNGVDTETFLPNKKTKEENLLLFVGRMHPNKGLHILLKSLLYLKTPTRLVVIGPRSSYSPKYYDEILELIKDVSQKTNHRISFLGIQTKEELVRWYQRATIFVCPSLSEPFGIVNLEALSCGTPVIASNVGGIPEVVKNHENGILVDAGAPEELASAIQSLVRDENSRNAFGEEGRKWVVSNFSSEAIAVRLLKLYHSLLEAI
ncbi:MAG TPA: glycosyltransferase family 4 protein [Acidobacteriota bacterium]|nr:glycosyltransferase family 4 protein [Acidobacteriota bacterium]